MRARRRRYRHRTRHCRPVDTSPRARPPSSDAVAAHAAPADFVESNDRLRVVFEVLPEARVDLAIKLGLELGVIGMLTGIERPQPVVPAIEVFAIRAAGSLLQLRDDAALYATGSHEWNQIE